MEVKDEMDPTDHGPVDKDAQEEEEDEVDEATNEFDVPHGIAETGMGLRSCLMSSTYRSRVTGNSNAHRIQTPFRAK
eukprot:scaffold16656_cov42-Attheya_sp.AAC.4